jgi:hypothetical protein
MCEGAVFRLSLECGSPAAVFAVRSMTLTGADCGKSAKTKGKKSKMSARRH